MLLKGCILNINILNLRLCLTHQHYTFQYAILSMVTGFVQVLENLESPGMLFWHSPGLAGKRPLVLESSGNMLNSTKKYEVYEKQ